MRSLRNLRLKDVLPYYDEGDRLQVLFEDFNDWEEAEELAYDSKLLELFMDWLIWCAGAVANDEDKPIIRYSLKEPDNLKDAEEANGN